MITLILVILTCIFTIASNAISIQCMNKNPDYKSNHESSFKFTVFCLVISIFLLLAGFVKIYIDSETGGLV